MLKDYFFIKWNEYWLWDINKKTLTLLAMYFWDCIKWQDGKKYYSYVWSEEWVNEFKKWWIYCDSILDEIYKEYANDDIDNLICEIVDKNMWNEDSSFVDRLNYYLTLCLSSDLWNKNYVLLKYTLFPNILSNV